MASGQELKAAARLIRALLRAGASVSVCDGEVWTVKRSRDFDEVFGAIATTGEDTIRGWFPEEENGGQASVSFWLIWGNAPDGSELIADHTVSERADRILSDAGLQV